MSSIIRAPKVGGQPRVLTVEKVASVAGKTKDAGNSEYVNKTDVVEKLKSAYDKDEITLLAEEAAETGASTTERGNGSVETTEYEDIPQNYYSSEIAAQVSDMTARLADANEELMNLKNEIHEHKERAKEEGYAEGYKNGVESADSEIQQRLNQMDSFMSGVSESLDNLVSNNEEMLVEIAFAAVTKILGNNLVTREGALAAIRQAAQHITKRDKLIFRVCEKDYQMLKNNPGQLLQNSELGQVEIIPDNHVQLGGCILETSSGSLDSRLEVQLNALLEILKSASAARNHD